MKKENKENKKYNSPEEFIKYLTEKLNLSKKTENKQLKK
jgi:hypothetical protein